MEPARPRIGELLGQMVALSGHDVEEILHEQHTSNRRFGEIALAWGLCQPEHVWSAWCRQLQDGDVCQTVDLEREGIDTQAVLLLPGELSRALRVVPVRCSETEIVLASASGLPDRARQELARNLRKQVKFVLAPRRQIDAAIEAYYPPMA